MTGFAADPWSWATERTTTGSPTQLSLQSSGLYTLSLWMREDGLRLDRLLLTTDTNYLPTGFGPAESARQGVNGSVTVPLSRTIVYTYDGLERLTDADYSTGEIYDYEYDPVGNRLKQIIDGDTTSYQYDAANRLDSVDGQSYSFDANGNLLLTGVMTNTFDGANRLVATTRAGTTLQPIYDGLNNRVGQIEGQTTTNLALDVAADLPEVIYTSEGSAYLHLPGVIVTEDSSGDVRYLLSDGLGSIRQAVNESGTVVAYREFDPYGNPIEAGGNPYGYTGEWWEDEVQLLHLRARWYAPETGTFLSVDPVESEPPYQYVSGNPVNRVDPSGMYEDDVHFGLTFRIADDLARSYGRSDIDRIGQAIGWGDQYIDEGFGVRPGAAPFWPGYVSKPVPEKLRGCNRCHFQPYNAALRHVQDAVLSNNPYILGATLHQYQDWYSHWNEGYTDSHFRNWLGKNYLRTPELLDEFFNGDTSLFQSYPAHPKEKIIQNIQQRNPGVNIGSLSDWDLVDLYFRNDSGLPSNLAEFTFTDRVRIGTSSFHLFHFRLSQELYSQRVYFTFHTDKYIEGSSRDMIMKNRTQGFISQWLIQHGPCDVDWRWPSDAEFRNALLN